MSDRSGIKTKVPNFNTNRIPYQHRKALACQMVMVMGVGESATVEVRGWFSFHRYGASG